MAGKAAAPGTAVLLVTANVGSLFDDVSAAPSVGRGGYGPGVSQPGTLSSPFTVRDPKFRPLQCLL